MKSIIIFLFGTALVSFTAPQGGEGFEISLNGKLVLQRFGSDINKINKLQLHPGKAELTVRYHHCGKIGKNRIICIKDMQNKTLKEFRYADAGMPVTEMICNMKDVIEILTGKGKMLKLYYTSSELPKGRLLTNIIMSNESLVKL